MDLGGLSQPVNVCVDPACRWAPLPERDHFDVHNPLCAQLFITGGSQTVACVLFDGHDGPHRGDLV